MINGGLMSKPKQRGRPITARSPWGPLAEKLGGASKLAEKLGVTRSTVNKWSLGVHDVPLLARKEVLRLCKYYGITEGLERV